MSTDINFVDDTGLRRDAKFMEQALNLAALGRGQTSPNPMVGAVVVTPNDTIVGTGYHTRAGEPHAEIEALMTAGAQARGATLYCTLEPCCHEGRTGPCAGRIVEAGVKRVVAAIEDPNPLVSGGGFRYLRENGIDVEIGVGAADALRLNEVFVTFMRCHRPFVTMKVALSLDGRIAAAPGLRTQLTSSGAKHAVDLLRSEVDAIAVGSGTILADDPLLTLHGVHRASPLTRVIMDTRLRTPVAARLFSTLDIGPVIIVTTEEAKGLYSSQVQALERVGARVVTTEARDIKSAVSRLADLRLTSLLLEGGTELHAAAWSAHIVDRVQIYVTPRTLGPGGVPWLSSEEFSLVSLERLRVEPCGVDVFIEGDVYRAN